MFSLEKKNKKKPIIIQQCALFQRADGKQWSGSVHWILSTSLYMDAHLYFWTCKKGCFYITGEDKSRQVGAGNEEVHMHISCLCSQMFQMATLKPAYSHTEG